MDQSRVHELLDELSDKIDNLEATVQPLTKTGNLNEYAETLPLLDRAKLYTTTAYAIESLLYNHLRLAGEDAKNHPVMTELNRVKQYFEKIKDAENPGRDRRPEGEHPLCSQASLYSSRQLTSSGTTLDKSVARRFIQHGIAGNKRLDQEQATKAKKKLEVLDEKMPVYAGKKRKFDAEGEYLPEVPAVEAVRDDSNNDSSTTNTTPEHNKLKNRSTLPTNTQSIARTETPEQKQERKRQQRRAKKERRRQRQRERDDDNKP
jgi:exosome complex protein LRP1